MEITFRRENRKIHKFCSLKMSSVVCFLNRWWQQTVAQLRFHLCRFKPVMQQFYFEMSIFMIR